MGFSSLVQISVRLVRLILIPTKYEMLGRRRIRM